MHIFIYSEQDVSELSRICNLLRIYGENGYIGIVKVCMISAMNFNSEGDVNVRHPDVSNSAFSKDGFREMIDESDVGLGLYHSGSILTGSDCEEGKKACYNCLLKEIIHIKNDSVNPVNEIQSLYNMIEYSLTICNSQLYRIMLYDCLLDEDENLLLKLKKNIHLEKFLKEKNPEVLYK